MAPFTSEETGMGYSGRLHWHQIGYEWENGSSYVRYQVLHGEAVAFRFLQGGQTGDVMAMRRWVPMICEREILILSTP